MIKNFDHCTVVVSNIDETKRFFALLGFREDYSTVISGDKFSTYMTVDNIEAEHVTLVLDGSFPQQEIQLLKYHKPAPLPDQNIARLDKIGYNHLCFAVDNIEQEVRRLKGKGVRFLNEIMEFKNRKLTFFSGPEGITLELCEKL